MHLNATKGVTWDGLPLMLSQFAPGAIGSALKPGCYSMRVPGRSHPPTNLDCG
jgi:hypothetical protein